MLQHLRERIAPRLDASGANEMRQLLRGLDYIFGQLDALGIADQTYVLVGSDFGRTPSYNNENGKDHWNVTSALVAGPGIAGNRAIGGSDGGLGWYVRTRGHIKVQKTHTLALSLNLTDAPRLQGGRVTAFNGNLTYNYSLGSLFRPKNTAPATSGYTPPLPSGKNQRS